MSIVSAIKKKLYNIPGWRTSRKIIVIESDDWGSIRTRSREDLDSLRNHNIRVDKCNYMLNDSLASESDLSELFSVLLSFKDFRGNYPVLSANCLVANPDFIKIKETNYSEYHYETIIDSLKKYPQHSNSFNLWKEGMRKGVFHPQSHGREHLNISRWMGDLRDNIDETRFAFELEMCGISAHISKHKRGSYQAAYDGGEGELIYDLNEIIEDGLKLFKKIFGYNSVSFISPNYVWNDGVEKSLYNNGIKYIQGSKVQYISNDFNQKRKVKRHFLGQKNKLNQIYLVRNCNFEPSVFTIKDWVNSCLSDIDIAFKWKRPAVISTHRVNYIGYINPGNRDRSLSLLKELLEKTLKKWPDTEFMTSDRLGKLISDHVAKKIHFNQ